MMILAVISPALAAKNAFNYNSRAQSSKQLYKENTGHCYYIEAVHKTNIGWKSNEEISHMSPRQREFIKFKNIEVNSRKVYVAKSLCSNKMAVRNLKNRI